MQRKTKARCAITRSPNQSERPQEHSIESVLEYYTVAELAHIALHLSTTQPDDLQSLLPPTINKSEDIVNMLRKNSSFYDDPTETELDSLPQYATLQTIIQQSRANRTKSDKYVDSLRSLRSVMACLIYVSTTETLPNTMHSLQYQH